MTLEWNGMEWRRHQSGGCACIAHAVSETDADHHSVDRTHRRLQPSNHTPTASTVRFRQQQKNCEVVTVFS